MPRPYKLDRPVRLEFSIPESLASKIKLELFSEVEGRVPMGAMSELAIRLFTEWLATERGVKI